MLWGVKIPAALVGLSIVVIGCSPASPPPAGPTSDAPGPPNARPGVIERHADQFANELPRRPPGSNEEQVAASYILGFLQQAGYPGRLEGVPVADLIRSTNVIATPPGGATPEYLVAVPDGTPSNEALDAHSIGVFLEVARALSVRKPAHPVEFVALGAEFAEQEAGTLGSRAMASLLREESLEPQIIYLSPELSGDSFHAEGPLASRFKAVPRPGIGPLNQIALAAANAYRNEGFEVTVIDGHPSVVADTLLEFLSRSTG
jgi:hypothetical protein